MSKKKPNIVSQMFGFFVGNALMGKVLMRLTTNENESGQF